MISFRIDWLDLLAVQGTLKNLFQHHSSKALVLQCCSGFFMVWLLYGQLSQLSVTTRKAITLTIWNFVSKVMSLLFNTLSRFLIAFRQEQVPLNFMAAFIVHSDFGAQGNKICHCFHFSPSICHEVMGLDTTILVFLMLSFKTAFSLSSFILIKKLFSSASLSTITVVSSAYLRLLIFLLAILISACDSSSLAFPLMHSALLLLLLFSH